MRGIHYIERNIYAQALVSDHIGLLSRSWTPDETIKDLEEQNEAIHG
jgi:hypothetical protein